MRSIEALLFIQVSASLAFGYCPAFMLPVVTLSQPQLQFYNRKQAPVSNHSVRGHSCLDLANVESCGALLHQSHNQLPKERADEVAHEWQEGRRESPGQRPPVIPQVVTERLMLILQQELRL